MLGQQRKGLYEELEERIGNTSLELYQGDVPNGNQIWIKRECDNPYGSHYDRVYLALFKHFEENGLIKLGDKALETTSGAAGASFAGIGEFLGYTCDVAIPKGVDQAIINIIRGRGAAVHLTPEEDYIAGFPTFLKDNYFISGTDNPLILKDKGTGVEYKFLNHSMGPRGIRGPRNNEITLTALEPIAYEALQEIEVDYYIAANGNGSSILGPGRAFRKLSNAAIIAFESFQSGVGFDLKYGIGEYEKAFGIPKGSLPRHRLRGTSYPGIDFPHMRRAMGIVDEVVLVSDREVDENYRKAYWREVPEHIPRWDLIRYKDFGRTTQAGIAVSLDLADRVSNKNFMIIAYDTKNGYDW